MQRVLVLGCSGAGKSTFARGLGAVTGLPVVHLDQLRWTPGWVHVERSLYNARVRDVVASERWIMDGNNPTTLDGRIPRADSIVLFDRSRALCSWRVLQRWARYYGRVRPDMVPGCPEKPDLEFLAYIWNFARDSRPKLIEAIDRHAAWERVVTIRREDDARTFLRRAAMS